MSPQIMSKSSPTGQDPSAQPPVTGSSKREPGKELRILIADDHEVMRRGVRFVIEQHPGWVICGEACDGRRAVAMAQELKPNIVILDMSMPELNGLEATRQIKRALPKTEVVIFTGDESEDVIRAVFEAGARSFILKTDVSQHLVTAIETLALHKHYFTTRVSELVFARYIDGKTGPGSDKTEGLTPRERELVQLLAEGRSNKEAASILGISTKTIETHRAAVMRKLKLDSFADLMRYAIRNKIVSA